MFGELTQIKLFIPTNVRHTASAIKKIKVGDKLLGPDNTVRNVLSILRGKGQLYNVRQSNGIIYPVGENHILSLVKYNHETREYDFLEIPAIEFIKGSKRMKNEWYGYKTIATASGKWKNIGETEIGKYDIRSKLSSLTFKNIGEGRYYGIEVDDDHRIMLNDHTVVYHG